MTKDNHPIYVHRWMLPLVLHKIKDSALTSPYPPSLGNKCDVAIY